MTQAETQALLLKLQAENEALKAKLETKVTQRPFAIRHRKAGVDYTGSDGKSYTGKGVVSVYLGQKNPTSLYPSQWKFVLGKAKDILDYIEANKAELATD